MALIGPTVELHDLAIIAQLPRSGQQSEAVQVFIIGAYLTVVAADLIGKVAEAAAVQAWHQNRALIIFEQAAVFLSDWRALGGADAEDQQRASRIP